MSESYFVRWADKDGKSVVVRRRTNKDDALALYKESIGYKNGTVGMIPVKIETWMRGVTSIQLIYPSGPERGFHCDICGERVEFFDKMMGRCQTCFVALKRGDDLEKPKSRFESQVEPMEDDQSDWVDEPIKWRDAPQLGRWGDGMSIYGPTVKLDAETYDYIVPPDDPVAIREFWQGFIAATIIAIVLVATVYIALYVGQR